MKDAISRSRSPSRSRYNWKSSLDDLWLIFTALSLSYFACFLFFLDYILSCEQKAMTSREEIVLVLFFMCADLEKNHTISIKTTHHIWYGYRKNFICKINTVAFMPYFFVANFL